MNQSLKCYLIPGLGVDQRLFEHLHLNLSCSPVNWLPLRKKESLPSYAKRLTDQIDFTDNTVLIGVSYGGMLAVEIAKKNPGCKVILISSAATRYELPILLRFLRFCPIHRLIPDPVYVWLACRFRWIFGISKEQLPLFKSMLQACPRPYFSRAVDSIAQWDNTWIPEQLFRIHGAKDLLIGADFTPQRNRHPEGKHYMIQDYGTWCSLQIEEWLQASGTY